MDLCRANTQTSNKWSLLLGKCLIVGISGFTVNCPKKYFSPICSRNSVVQLFSLWLKSPVQEGNEVRFSSLRFIWWNPASLYHIGSVDPLWVSPRSYVTSHKDCRSLLTDAAFHPKWCNVLPSSLCDLFYSKDNIKYDWVIRILPMATSREQLHYSWEFVLEVGSYTRNKIMKYQIGKVSYFCFILAGTGKK